MSIVPSRSSFEGEIIGAGDTVRVVAALHPLRVERVELSARVGDTIADIVNGVVALPNCSSLARDFVVYIDGHPIEAKNWHRIRPKPGAVVVLRPVVEGFIAPIFAALSAAFSAFSAFIGGLGFVGKLTMAGISFGLKLLMNALFAPRPPKLSQPKQTYSLTGARNQAAPFEPVPVVLGKHRISPFYGAMPYTESVGDLQYLRLLFVWGYGPLQVEDIKIGETPLTSFEEVEIETRTGYPGDLPITLYPRQVVEEPLSVDLKFSGGWHRRNTAANINEISLDFVMPNGLMHIDNKGRKGRWRVIVRVRYRLFGTSDWTNAQDLEVWGQTVDAIRRGITIQVPAGEYEVEVSRGTGDYDGGNTVYEAAVWTALRGFRTGAPLTFGKPLCISAIKIKATSQLNGSLDTLNGVVTSLVRSWNGTTWVDNQPSRNPADLFRHALQGSANARPVSDEAIDLAALQGWHAYCVANKWTFDHPRVAAASVFDTLADICAAGRAVPIFKDGLWSVVWDEQDTPIVQMFTPRNSWGFEAQHEFRELPQAWRVRFINEKRGWRDDERIVYDDGFTAENATRFEGIEFPGVTDPDAIWKHGRFHLAQLRLRPETYTLNVDFENLVCTRADRVRVAHDVMLVGIASGRVTGVDVGTQTISVDELVMLESDKLYQVRFRRGDGSLHLRTVVTVHGETRVLQFSGSGEMPAAGDLFTFGEAERETGVYRILAIEPQDELTARVTLVDDAPGIYAADSGVVPPFESNITVPFDPFTQPPSNLLVFEGVDLTGDGSTAAAQLYWTAPTLGQIQAYEVEIRDEADPEERWSPAAVVLAPVSVATINGLIPSIYTFRIRSRFANGDVSRWNTSSAVAIDTLLNPPPDVGDFRISVLGDLSTLSWQAVDAQGISYEIRFVGISSSSVDWNSATVLIPQVSGISVQVPTMVGTYLIKASLPTGLKSANAAAVQSTIAALAGLNVVEVLTEDPGYPGGKTNVTVDNGVLRLLPNNVLSKWEALSAVTSLAVGDGAPDSVGLAVAGTYAFANNLDLGDIFTSRVTAVIDAAGENTANVMSGWVSLASVASLDALAPEDWSVLLEYRTSQSDPILNNWTDWAPFVVGDVTARAFEFRLQLEGKAADQTETFGLITPAVRALRVQIDMPDRVVAGEDIVVPVAGLDIDFLPKFRSLHGIATADQDMATGDRKVISAKGPAGFHIQFFNAAGTPVERTIDYVAKGYGSILQ